MKILMQPRAPQRLSGRPGSHLRDRPRWPTARPSRCLTAAAAAAAAAAAIYIYIYIKGPTPQHPAATSSIHISIPIPQPLSTPSPPTPFLLVSSLLLSFVVASCCWKLEFESGEMGGRLRRGGGLLVDKKHAASAGGALPPSPDSVLARLDQIDIRLKQLEDNQRLPPPQESYFTTSDLRRPVAAIASLNHQQQQQLQQQRKPSSLSSALREVHLKGNLIDRLRLLESRILTISYELEDKGYSGSSSSAASFSTGLTGDGHGWIQPASSGKKLGDAAVSSRRFVMGGGACSSKILAAETYQGQMSSGRNKVKKDPRLILDAAGMKASDMCRGEKRRIERTRIYRRWFPVGC